METIQKELIIIGAGPGGYVAALSGAKKGKRVLLIDEDALGGTCLNVGCIPTKALIHSSKLYYQAKNSRDLGIVANNLVFDLNTAVTHKDKITGELVSGIRFLLDKYQVEFVKGKASFLSDEKIIVKTADEKLSFSWQDLIIATGSKTRHLNISGIDQVGVLDSTQLLANTEKINSLTVIGGGIIGLEFAFMYAQMGVSVEVIEFLNQVLPMIDKDVTLRLHRYAKQLGISLNLNSQVTRIEKLDNGLLRTYYMSKGVEKYADSEKVLEAVGRIPNIDGLHIENTSLEITKQGISVDNQMRTNLAHVYAIGDVTGKMQLAHVASHQALIVIEQLFDHQDEMSYDRIPSVIFTTPQIASVGLNEQMCNESGISYIVKKVPFSASGRALVEGSETGFIKYLVDETKTKILGATVFGDDAEHLISSITIMMTNHLTFEQVKETVFAHPTTDELIHESALGFLKEAIHFVE